MAKLSGFPLLFDSNLADLPDMLGDAASEPCEQIFLVSLIAYLTCDLATLELELRNAQTILSAGPIEEIISLCVQLRFEMRVRKISSDTIHQLNLKAMSLLEWSKEAAFLIALAYDQLHQEQLFHDWNRRASHHLAAIGCEKKSVRALANAVAALSRLHPERHCIPDLLHPLSRARKIDELTTVTITLIHLSREYYELGAQRVALRYVNRAHAISSRHAGNLTIYNALLEHCHLYARTGLVKESRSDFEECSMPPFLEISAVLAKIKKDYPSTGDSFAGAPQVPNSRAIPMFWSQTESAVQQAAKLSPLESKHLTPLSTKPMSKFELIAELYGNLISKESAENRLHNLLNRLRTKRAELILLFENFYRLREIPMLEAAK